MDRKIDRSFRVKKEKEVVGRLLKLDTPLALLEMCNNIATCNTLSTFCPQTLIQFAIIKKEKLTSDFIRFIFYILVFYFLI